MEHSRDVARMDALFVGSVCRSAWMVAGGLSQPHCFAYHTVYVVYSRLSNTHV